MIGNQDENMHMEQKKKTKLVFLLELVPPNYAFALLATSLLPIFFNK
jgi:hypothetical protein